MSVQYNLPSIIFFSATFPAHPTYFSTNHVCNDVSHKGDRNEVEVEGNFEIVELYEIFNIFIQRE